VSPPAAHPDIVIAGDSHTLALVGSSWRDDAEEVATLVPVPQYERVNALRGAWPRRPEYWQRLLDVSVSYRVAISWRGNEHNGRYLLQLEELFDFVYNGDPFLDVDERATLVPESLVRASYTELQELGELLDRFSGSANRPVVIGPPPPKRSSEQMWRRFFRPGAVATEGIFAITVERLGLTLNRVCVTPAPIRMKLWRVLQEEYQRICRERRVPYLPPPRECLDAEGYLCEECSADDSTHANAVYGAIVVAQLKQLVEG